MMRVIKNHRRAAEGRIAYEDLAIAPTPLNRTECPYKGLAQRAAKLWAQVEASGAKYGFRNAQVSVIAPTGTIGLIMDCDTTGIEPDFALVKFKKLAGGGHFKIINSSVPAAPEIPWLYETPSYGHRKLRTRVWLFTRRAGCIFGKSTGARV